MWVSKDLKTLFSGHGSMPCWPLCYFFFILAHVWLWILGSSNMLPMLLVRLSMSVIDKEYFIFNINEPLNYFKNNSDNVLFVHTKASIRLFLPKQGLVPPNMIVLPQNYLLLITITNQFKAISEVLSRTLLRKYFIITIFSQLFFWWYQKFSFFLMHLFALMQLCQPAPVAVVS